MPLRLRGRPPSVASSLLRSWKAAGVLCALALVVAVPSAAQSGELDDLGPAPVDCGVLGRDYADPTCLTQTRNGTFSLSPHVVQAGGTLTGTIGNRCKRHEKVGFDQPPDANCPIDWNQMLSIGKRVSGCGQQHASCTVRISKRATTQKYTIVTVGITSDQGTGISKDYYGVVGKGRFAIAGHVKDELGEPMANVPVLITGAGAKERRKTDVGGAYNAVLRSGRYVVTADREDLKPVESRDCQPAGRSCRVHLIQNRTADFEVKAPVLIFSAKLGARVRSHKSPALIKAGTPFLIHVTLRNTSRKHRLLVYPIYGALEGNASDGHLQPPGPVRQFTADGTLDEVKPSPYLVLKPKQTREFDVVVRTTASDAFAEIGESAGGGTRAVVRFSPPKVAKLSKDNKLTVLDSKKAVQMKEGSDEFTVSIDDSAPEPPPANAYEATFSIAKGLVLGLWNITWGTVRGLLWDLPKLALQAISKVPSAALAYVQYEVELWESIKNDPAAVAAFMNPLTHYTLIAVKEAPFLVEKAEELYGQINESVSARYNKMWRDWYAGDWRAALTDMTAEGTEQLGNVALALAPGVLARLPKVQEAWTSAKVALYTKVAEQLAAIVKPGVTALQATRALSGIMKAGKILTDLELAELYGISAKQAAWLRGYARARKLAITFRSRAQASLKWLEQGAALKPAWIKLKTVNWHDVKYLGYSEADIGRLVLRKPPTRAEFYNEIYPKIPVGERADAAKRWFQRSQEWETGEAGLANDLLKWHADRQVTGKWPWQENLVNAELQADEAVTTGFRLTRRPGSGPAEYLVEVEVPPASGRYVSVTGDVDFLAITKANGAPLTDAEHVKILNEMRAGPVGAMHPETATWKAPLVVKEKYGLANGGKCCPAQIGADGKARAVQYNRKLSFFQNPEKYRIWWDGGYLQR